MFSNFVSYLVSLFKEPKRIEYVYYDRQTDDLIVANFNVDDFTFESILVGAAIGGLDHVDTNLFDVSRFMYLGEL